MEPFGTENYDVALSNLYRELLSDISLTQKIESIADVVTTALGADFSRIWITRPGDLCERGCLHGPVKDGPHVCRERSSCLHLIASSGRYTHIDGGHRRVPFGAYKIGRIASGEWSHFVTNDVIHDERVHDHEWAKRLGLISFAGYRLVSSDGRTVGVLAMFSKKVITSTEENLLETFAAIASQVIMVGVVQETLRESEEKYRTLVDNMQDAVYRCDLDGNVIFATPSAARLLGYSSVEQLIGMNIAKEFYLDPQERKKLVAVLNERGGVTDYEVTLKRKDNTPLVVSTSSHVYRDRDGAITGIEGVYRDITDRRRMEEEIRKSRDELEQRVKERTRELRRQAELFELAHDAIVIRDLDLRIVGWNRGAERMYGYSKGEATGQISQVVLQTQYPIPLEQIVSMVKEKEYWEGELVRTAKDGRQVTILSRWSLQKDEEGNPNGITDISLDITEHKRLEEQLRQAQKMEALGTFAGGIAHDFNNILAAIIGFCELARDKIPETSAAHRHLDRVFTAGLRGRDLVRQILTFSRQAQPERKALQLGVLVRETVKLLRASIPATIHIQVNAKIRSHFVLADRIQMQQVLMNLCANAAQAMTKSGGTITIDVDSVSFFSLKDVPHPALNPGHYVKLSVTDTGEGMTPETAGKIFDPFFTTKKPTEGTGLGLPVAHGIVANHGGAITVWSEPGRGSIFSVYIPEYSGEEGLTSRERDAEIPHGHERVLFIDDEEQLAQMAGEMLTRLGYTVTCRTSGREALALIRSDSYQFDLVITDQTMPEMTGLQLAKELRVIRPELPIILCTGFSNQVDAESGKLAGISAFVLKPLTRTEIAKTIREVLDK